MKQGDFPSVKPLRTLLYTLLPVLLLLLNISAGARNKVLHQQPLRVAVVGLTHDHVHWILGRKKAADIELVGIAEPDRALAERYSKRHGYSMNLVYATMEEMIAATKPEAVLVFTNIYDHLKVVEYCAPRGIHVMVEKPLAVSPAHAEKMIALAKKHQVHLLTNYETTWYGSNARGWELVNEQRRIGDIRKIVFHTGHQGPVEIGCSKEFLSWLTDPVLNGAGALTDFGCYGANIATWLLQGETPLSVTAVTQHIKPTVYPKVEDEATVILKYKKRQVIIQASWNWPYNRKDMEVYGQTGYVFCKDANNMVIKEGSTKETVSFSADNLAKGRNDPFAYFAAVIRGNIKLSTYDLSASANNAIVVKILAAAKLSAATGKTVSWQQINGR